MLASCRHRGSIVQKKNFFCHLQVDLERSDHYLDRTWTIKLTGQFSTSQPPPVRVKVMDLNVWVHRVGIMRTSGEHHGKILFCGTKSVVILTASWSHLVGIMVASCLCVC